MAGRSLNSVLIMPLIRIDLEKVRRVLNLRVTLMIARVTVVVIVVGFAVIVGVDGRGGGGQEQRRPGDRWGTSLRRTEVVVMIGPGRRR